MKTESQPQGCLKYFPFLKPFMVIDKPIPESVTKPKKTKLRRMYFKRGKLMVGQEFVDELKKLDN